MAPPDGDLTNDKIRPLEMLAETVDGVLAFSARCVLEDGDGDMLRAGGNVWITFYGAVTPFSVTVAEQASAPGGDRR